MIDVLRRVRVVMVETKTPGNIGAAARAMKSMGLSQLYLVNPTGVESKEARARAMSAVDVLEHAVICESIDEAIAGCHLVMGTSARQRSLPWPMLTPQRATHHILESSPESSIALLFGRESSGLKNDELARCHHHIYIPTTEECSSLNLASAVQIIAYELRMATLNSDHIALTPWDELRESPPVDVADLERYFKELEGLLIQLSFLDPQSPKKLMTRLRRLYMRSGVDQSEMNILRGILVAIQRAHLDDQA